MTSAMRGNQLRMLARKRLDQATRGDFQLFLRRVLKTVNPRAEFQGNWHLDALGAHLEGCAKGDITRLIVNMPPRMLKSTLISVAWPAWLLGHDPGIRIMAASYAQSLATRHSHDCRLVMQSEWYQRVFPEAVLSDAQNEKDRFATVRGGHRIATSVGGAATGEGGTILIVDDPLNPMQAGYTTQRDAVNEWFDHTFATRLDDKQHGAIVVVMQRLHKEDLSGYLLARGDWKHLNLPAIAPQQHMIAYGDYRHMREEGEVLHAAREPLELLDRARRELGSAHFNAQYQQQPASSDGALIKPHWFPRFDSAIP